MTVEPDLSSAHLRAPHHRSTLARLQQLLVFSALGLALAWCLFSWADSPLLSLGGAALVQLAGSGATAFRLEGQVLHLSGPVNGAAADRLQRMMEENPQITVIALGDMPGADDVV